MMPRGEELEQKFRHLECTIEELIELRKLYQDVNDSTSKFGQLYWLVGYDAAMKADHLDSMISNHNGGDA